MDGPATDVREPTGGAPEAATPADVASLLNELRTAKAELEARNEALRLVNDLTFRLQRRLDPEAIAAETAEALRGGSAPPLVAIYLLDGPDGPLRLVAGRGFTEEELVLGARLPLEGSASGRAVRERRIVSLGEVRVEGREVHPVMDALARRHVASGLCIPLAHGGRPLGTVNVIFPEGRPLRPEEAETFEGVARAVSLAVANAGHRSELEERAFRDALTRLPNRAGFHRRFGTLAETVGGGRAALVLLDLDWFREINDTLGHNFGDELLVQVGARLSERCADGMEVFRLGGDEFAIVVPGAESREDGEAAARKILAWLGEPFRVAGMGLEVGACAGVACFPSHARVSHGLLRCADVALHVAKKGSGGVACYEPDLDEHTPERLTILSDLGRAIREGQLVLHFQPKVALQYDFIEGFEALVRWRHPRLGLLGSGQFVPFAEATDGMVALTSWVVRRALEQLSVWNRQLPKLTMAVNLSARNLVDRSCPEKLEEIVRSVGVDPGLVEFELTESAVMSDPETALKMLGRMHDSGARLAIDDFGTGYSSLAYLTRLPVDVLKIDRSFVAGMAAGGKDLAVVRSTVQLAHSLDLGVVAEGVEDATTARTLREMGCDLGQGYFFAPPAPAEEAERLLAGGGFLAAR